MDHVAGKFTTLRDVGKDEAWLQKWITEDPSRLGLGPIQIKHHELRQYGSKGGRLDILAYRSDMDTFYEIEVMLGECDSDHGFRALDYWAREKLAHPNARHVAVLVAEDLSGRYKTVIETLPQFLPFVGIELKTQRLRLPNSEEVATTFAAIVAQPDALVLGAEDEPAGEKKGVSPRDEEWWRKEHGEALMEVFQEIFRVCEQHVGPSRLDFSAKSYVSLKKGGRCWLPMWPRKDGVYVYLPGGPGGMPNSPSSFFERIKAKLAPLGIEPNWTYKYNAGANPIAFALPRQHVNNSEVLTILKEAYGHA